MKVPQAHKMSVLQLWTEFTGVGSCSGRRTSGGEGKVPTRTVFNGRETCGCNGNNKQNGKRNGN